MTRSKLKEVVEKGVVRKQPPVPRVCVCACVCVLQSALSSQVIPAWNISPIKKSGDVKKVRLSQVLSLLSDPQPRLDGPVQARPSTLDWTVHLGLDRPVQAGRPFWER